MPSRPARDPRTGPGRSPWSPIGMAGPTSCWPRPIDPLPAAAARPHRGETIGAVVELDSPWPSTWTARRPLLADELPCSIVAGRTRRRHRWASLGEIVPGDDLPELARRPAGARRPLRRRRPYPEDRVQVGDAIVDLTAIEPRGGRPSPSADRTRRVGSSSEVRVVRMDNGVINETPMVRMRQRRHRRQNVGPAGLIVTLCPDRMPRPDHPGSHAGSLGVDLPVSPTVRAAVALGHRRRGHGSPDRPLEDLGRPDADGRVMRSTVRRSPTIASAAELAGQERRPARRAGGSAQPTRAERGPPVSPSRPASPTCGLALRSRD